MQLSVTFKNIDSSEYLKRYAQEKLDRLDKLLDHPGKADLVLRVERQTQIAEISLKSNHLSIHAKEENKEMHAAIDLATDKLKRQITKSKEKLQTRRTRAGGLPDESDAPDEPSMVA